MSRYHERKRLEHQQQQAKIFNNYTDLKEVITQHLLTQDGSFNSAVLRRDYFKCSKFVYEVEQTTSFLKKDCHIRQRLYCILHDITKHPKCVVCGKNASFSPSKNGGFLRLCDSPKCKQNKQSREKRNQTMMKKYGQLVSEKTKEAARNRASQLYEKGRETLKQKYGVDNPGQLPDHVDKVKDTMITKYGVDHVFKKPEFQQQLEQKREQYYRKIIDSYPGTELKSIVRDEKREQRRGVSSCTPYLITFKCGQCSQTETLTSETLKWRHNNAKHICSVCSELNVGSVQEQQLRDFVKKIIPDVEILTNTRQIIPPLELDIFIPSLNIAIEYNGMFWHSEQPRINPTYHLDKTKKCEEIGIQLIHIFESDWLNKEEQIKSRLMHMFCKTKQTIYARKCVTERISSKQAAFYLKKWHLQGSKTGEYNLALTYNGQVISIMTFGKPRFSRKYQWELLRYCNMPSANIPGGASKMFKRFLKDNNPSSVVTYANRAWSTGKLYEVLDFQFSHYSAPNYFYWDMTDNNMTMYSRVCFQKHKLKDKLEHYDPILTEYENMFNNGYRRVWDCGNGVWIWESK